MNRNQVKGAAKDMSGKVQEKIGEATGSRKQEAKGIAKQAVGKTQEAIGNAQQGAKRR